MYTEFQILLVGLVGEIGEIGLRKVVGKPAWPGLLMSATTPDPGLMNFKLRAAQIHGHIFKKKVETIKRRILIFLI